LYIPDSKLAWHFIIHAAERRYNGSLRTIQYVTNIEDIDLIGSYIDYCRYICSELKGTVLRIKKDKRR